MNPNIARLAQQPRGKAYRSRLIPHDADIWRWLAAGDTYQAIVLKLRERGLSVSITAVHGYVSVRARRRHASGHLPGPLATNTGIAEDAPVRPILPPCKLPQTSHCTTEQVASREFVFQPSQTRHEALREEDLALNDPTKY